MAKILLVEDNEFNRDMLSRRLERQGYTVVMAVDGQEGVNKAEAEVPDLILMDVKMPVMDGYDATRRLKSATTTQRIPIIALTAYAMPGDREKALEAGCNDYAVKPIELTMLLEKMRTLLQQDQQSP